MGAADLGIPRFTQKQTGGGFMLLEVLVAFAVLVTGLTLIAAAMIRHLHVVRMLTDSVTASRAADHALLRELLRRQEDLELEQAVDLPEGFTSQVLVEEVPLEAKPMEGLIMEWIRAQVSWRVRDRSRASEMSTGIPGSGRS